MRTKTKRLAIIAALAAVLVGGTLWRISPRQDMPRPSATEDNARYPGEDGNTAVSPALSGPSRAALDLPLPQADREHPLERRFEDLGARADRGDPVAACQLAWGLQVCRESPRIDQHLPQLESLAIEADRKNPKQAERLLEEAMALRTLSAEASKLCESLSEEHASQHALRLYQAARSGHIPSMVRFALSPPFEGEDASESGSTLRDAYEQSAISMLESAADHGDPEAIYGVFKVHSDGYLISRYGRLDVRKDPARAYAAAKMLKQFNAKGVSTEIQAALSELSKELDPAAYDIADQIYQRYKSAFSGTMPDEFTHYQLHPKSTDPCGSAAQYRRSR